MAVPRRSSGSPLKVSTACLLIVAPLACSGGGPTAQSNTVEITGADLEWVPEGEAVCQEDFTRFSDWATFLAEVACITTLGQLDNWGRDYINVEASDNGYGATGQGLWYRFRARPEHCSDHIVGQASIPLPSGTREVWVEWAADFSANFDTRNSNCTSPEPDYKFLLLWLNKSPERGNRRAEVKMGTRGPHLAAATVGYPPADDVPIHPGSNLVSGDDSTAKYPPETVYNPVAQQYLDGQTHVYRAYFAILGEAKYGVYVEVDGVVTHRYVTNSVPDEGLFFDSVMLGSNRNLGAEEDMYLTWKNVEVWAR